MRNSGSKCSNNYHRNADRHAGRPRRIELLMDEIACSTEYIVGEEDCKSFISVLKNHGIETADQFIDAFCVEYEGIVESVEFVVIVFNGNTYFFRRLCGVPRCDSDN